LATAARGRARALEGLRGHGGASRATAEVQASAGQGVESSAEVFPAAGVAGEDQVEVSDEVSAGPAAEVAGRVEVSK